MAANPSGLISTPAPSVSSDTAAVCLSCRELERKCYGVQHKLEENQDVVERLRRDMKERLRCREQEIKHLEGENQAIHAQVSRVRTLTLPHSHGRTPLPLNTPHHDLLAVDSVCVCQFTHRYRLHGVAIVDLPDRELVE